VQFWSDHSPVITPTLEWEFQNPHHHCHGLFLTLIFNLNSNPKLNHIPIPSPNIADIHPSTDSRFTIVPYRAVCMFSVQDKAMHQHGHCTYAQIFYGAVFHQIPPQRELSLLLNYLLDLLAPCFTDQ